MGGSEGSPSPSSVSTGGSRLGAARARVDGGMREGWSRAGADDVFYEASAAGVGVRGACLMTSAWIRYEDRALCGSGHVCITALMYGCGEIRSNVVVLAMPVVKLS